MGGHLSVQGWILGENCTELLSLRSCVHGSAKSAEELCVCDDGWTGEHCNIPECKDGCSSEYGYCSEPDECMCKLGWEGELCDQCVPYPGCDVTHGSCKEPWECNCESGWTGIFCNETSTDI